jgi:diketogulonate reductase-like aldo/keto reductase
LKTNVSFDKTLKKVEQSLKDSSVDQISLYLLHSPIGGPSKRKACEHRIATISRAMTLRRLMFVTGWEACIEAKKRGWVKSIGVSNFGVKHIEEFEQWGLEKPVLNQVDLHPFMRRQAIVDVCRKHGIILEVSLRCTW